MLLSIAFVECSKLKPGVGISVILSEVCESDRVVREYGWIAGVKDRVLREAHEILIAREHFCNLL